jgi:hypothetical protein
MNRAVRAAAVVAAIVAALIAGAAFAGPSDQVGVEHPERIEPVVRSASVCPYVGGEPNATSVVGVLAIPGVDEPAPLPPDADDADDADEADEADEAAAISVQRLYGEDDEDAPEPITTVSERAVRSLETVDENNPAPYAVRAHGPLAPGVVAEQWMYADGPDLRGLVTASCTAPEREHWFVGASTAAGNRGRLLLSNLSPTPATATVSLWGADGPIETSATREITVGANAQELLLLEALAPDHEHLAVHVEATRGRVAAAIDHRETEDGEPRGISMIPAATAPSDTVVVPGVPGDGDRSLRIFTPGSTDAFVSVEVLAPDGSFRPVDLDALVVPAEGVLEVPVSDAVGDEPTAIRLVSDEPITAALRVVRTESEGLPDIAYSAATSALPAGPLAIVMGRDDDELSSGLIFSAVGEMGGRVVVRTLDEDGEVVDDETVELTGGSTREVELAASGSWVTAVIDVSAAGTIVGARQIVGSDDAGRLADLMPLTAPQLTVLVPEVAGELAP